MIEPVHIWQQPLCLHCRSMGSCQMPFLLQVKQQTVKERQQAELRLEEAHQAEENAMAQLQTLRKDCRQVLPCFILLYCVMTTEECHNE